MKGVGSSSFLEKSVALPRLATVSNQPCLKALFLTEVAWTFFFWRKHQRKSTILKNSEEFLDLQRISAVLWKL